MEEAPENGKESSNSAHASGMDEELLQESCIEVTVRYVSRAIKTTRL